MPDKVHKYTLHVFVGGEALSDREQDKLCEQIEAVSDPNLDGAYAVRACRDCGHFKGNDKKAAKAAKFDGVNVEEQHLNDPLREYLLAQAKDENGFTE